jgi:hypothetical protein
LDFCQIQSANGLEVTGICSANHDIPHAKALMRTDISPRV